MIDIIKIAPGYKPIQYVYMFYALKYGVVAGIVAALIYPLPYSILFLMITVDLNVPFICIFMLAGMRSGTLALLLKYCMHFPRHGFHWIVLVFTVLIGILFQNSNKYIKYRLHLYFTFRDKYFSVILYTPTLITFLNFR